MDTIWGPNQPTEAQEAAYFNATREGTLMSETKHTPGQRAANAVLSAVFDRCTLRPGCSTRGMFSEIEGIIDRETAAPDLLAALREIMQFFDHQGDTRPYTWQERKPILDAARAAIQKAEKRA